MLLACYDPRGSRRERTGKFSMENARKLAPKAKQFEVDPVLGEMQS
jgi:hypothetical protein